MKNKIFYKISNLYVLLFLPLIFLNCKGSQGDSSLGTIAATPENRIKKTIKIQETANNNFFGDCGNTTKGFLMKVKVEIKVFEAGEWKLFGPGAQVSTTNFMPNLDITNVQVPKNGEYTIEVSVISDECMTCCQDMIPLFPSDKKCSNSGIPLWFGFIDVESGNSDVVQPVDMKFNRCTCC